MEKSSDIETEYVNFLKDIIAIPSPTGREGELADFIKKKFIENNITECFTDRCGNLIAVLKGSGKGPDIMLNGHLDTVPPGKAEEWTPYDPYKAVIDSDNNIYGRGSCDMKGGLAVLFFVMLYYRKRIEEGLELPGDLIFSAVVHEEAAEMLGMEYLLEKTLPENNLKSDLVLLAEPTNGDLAIGQRGKIELVIRTKGKTAHSSDPKAGINALEKMIPVLEYIFREMPQTMTSDPAFGEGTVTVTDCKVSPGALSVIPDECEISVDRRYMPDESIDSLLTEFENLFSGLREKDSDFRASVTPRHFNETSYTGYSKEIKKYHPPWIMDTDNTFVVKSLEAVRSTGQDPAVKYWKSGCDGSMSCGIHKIPTIGYSWGEEKWVHKPQERVNIDRMIMTYNGYIAIVRSVMDLKQDRI